MKVYHYSNAKISTEIKTVFFGKNLYTNRDKNIYNKQRVYFYQNAKDVEFNLKNTKYLYLCEIDDNTIYDVKKDNLKLKEKFKSIDKIINFVLNKKYKGILYFIGNVGIVVSFFDVEFKQVNKLF